MPPETKCPVSLAVMTDPVVVSTGQTFERSAIQRWMADGHATCPLSRAPLSPGSVPNLAVRSIIDRCGRELAPLQPALPHAPAHFLSAPPAPALAPLLEFAAAAAPGPFVPRVAYMPSPAVARSLAAAAAPAPRRASASHRAPAPVPRVALLTSASVQREELRREEQARATANDAARAAARAQRRTVATPIPRVAGLQTAAVRRGAAPAPGPPAAAAPAAASAEAAAPLGLAGGAISGEAARGAGIPRGAGGAFGAAPERGRSERLSVTR